MARAAAPSPPASQRLRARGRPRATPLQAERASTFRPGTTCSGHAWNRASGGGNAPFISRLETRLGNEGDHIVPSRAGTDVIFLFPRCPEGSYAMISTRNVFSQPSKPGKVGVKCVNFTAWKAWTHRPARSRGAGRTERGRRMKRWRARPQTERVNVRIGLCPRGLALSRRLVAEVPSTLHPVARLRKSPPAALSSPATRPATARTCHAGLFRPGANVVAAAPDATLARVRHPRRHPAHLL
jgi:hypothetical protein